VANVVELGLRVNAKGVAEGTAQLERLAQAGQKAETSAKNLAGATDRTSTVEERAAVTRGRKLAALERDLIAQQRLLEAHRRGVQATREVEASLAGEAAARRLGAQATAEQVQQARRLGEETHRLKQRIEDQQKTSAGVVESYRRIAIQAAAVTAAVAGATVALERLAERGGRVITVESAFAQATGDAQGAIEKLRTASRGLLSDYDLMTAANQALTLGSADNVEGVGELIEVSQKLGKALGIDAKYALESLNTGIARQSRLYLDNLGIIVDVEGENQRYAASLGRTAASLTEAEKREVFRTAALETAHRKVLELGGAEETAGDASARLRVALANARDELARIVAQSGEVIKFFNNLAAGVNEVSERLQTFIYQNKLATATQEQNRAAILRLIPGMREAAEKREQHAIALVNEADAMLRGTVATDARTKALAAAIEEEERKRRAEEERLKKEEEATKAAAAAEAALKKQREEMERATKAAWDHSRALEAAAAAASPSGFATMTSGFDRATGRATRQAAGGVPLHVVNESIDRALELMNRALERVRPIVFPEIPADALLAAAEAAKKKLELTTFEKGANLFANTVQGVFQGIGQGLLGLGQQFVGMVLDLGSQLFRDIFGSGHEDRERERMALEKQQIEALNAVAKNLEEFGARLAGMAASQVNEFRDVLAFFRTGRDAGGAAGVSTGSLQNAASFFGIDASKGLSNAAGEALAKLIEDALRIATEQVQARLGSDLAARAAALGGDEAKAAEIRRAAAAAAEIKELEELARAGFITAEKLAEFTGIIGGELRKALEDAAKAAEAAAEAARFERDAMEQGIDALLLRAQGRNAEADAIEREIALEREVRRVREEFGDALAEEYRAARLALQAEQDLAAARRRSADLQVMLLEALGLNELAEYTRLIQGQKAALQEFIDAGASQGQIALLQFIHGLQRQNFGRDEGVEESNRLATEQNDILREQLSTQQQLVDTTRRVVESLTDFSKSLSSPTSPPCPRSTSSPRRARSSRRCARWLSVEMRRLPPHCRRPVAPSSRPPAP